MVKEIMEFLQYIFSHINNNTIGYFLSLIVVLVIVKSIYNLHTDEHNGLFLSDLFRDRGTKKISGSKFRLNLAFLVTAWAVVYCVLANQAVEVVLTAFITAWVADRKLSRDASKIPNPVVDDKLQNKLDEPLDK